MTSIEEYRKKVNSRKGSDSGDKHEANCSVGEDGLPDSPLPEFLYDLPKNRYGVTGDEEIDILQADPEKELSDSSCERVFYAHCYLIWGEGFESMWESADDHRVYCDGKARRICLEIRASDEQDALTKINLDKYELIEWWKNDETMPKMQKDT